MSGRLSVSTVDYHTGGEPFRIVDGGVEPLPGRTILDKRRFSRIVRPGRGSTPPSTIRKGSPPVW